MNAEKHGFPYDVQIHLPVVFQHAGRVRISVMTSVFNTVTIVCLCSVTYRLFGVWMRWHSWILQRRLCQTIYWKYFTVVMNLLQCSWTVLCLSKQEESQHLCSDSGAVPLVTLKLRQWSWTYQTGWFINQMGLFQTPTGCWAVSFEHLSNTADLMTQRHPLQLEMWQLCSLSPSLVDLSNSISSALPGANKCYI